jgi:hypothetical protein
MQTAYAVIKNMLWDNYGYLLPDDPSSITGKILQELDINGYKITDKFLDDNPKNMFGRESAKENNGATQSTFS